MVESSFLSLHKEWLKPTERWECSGSELFLIFPQNGTWELTRYSTTQDIGAGDAVILSGRAGAKLGPIGKTASEMVWFSVSLENLFPLFGTDEIYLLQDLPNELRVPKIYPATHPLAVRCRGVLAEIAPKNDLIHRSLLLRAAAIILSAEFDSRKQHRQATRSAEDHMMQVFEQLPAQQLLNLSVGELSQKFGCSRRHLNRLFHQRFGLSVATLRMELRLLKASFLLRDPDVKIINVAEQCAFNHLGLFNTCFKRRFGVTPGVWRNMQTGKTQKGKSSTNDTCPLRLNGLCPWNEKESDCQPQNHAAAPTQTRIKSQPPSKDFEFEEIRQCLFQALPFALTTPETPGLRAS